MTSSLTRWPRLTRWGVCVYGDTEGGHCQGACRPQWFFYVPLKVSETALPLYGHAGHEICPVSAVEGRDINLHKLTLFLYRMCEILRNSKSLGWTPSPDAGVRGPGSPGLFPFKCRYTQEQRIRNFQRKLQEATGTKELQLVEVPC